MLCPECLPQARGGNFLTPDGLEGSYAMEYSSELGLILGAYKDKNRLALAADLATHVVSILRPALETSSPDLILTPGSSKANFKKRGFVPSEHLVSAALRKLGSKLPVQTTKYQRQTFDQRGLGAATRRDNLSGAMAVQRLRGKSVLVFDDVYTTGATLSEITRVAKLGGGLVTEVCVLAKRI